MTAQEQAIDDLTPAAANALYASIRAEWEDHADAPVWQATVRHPGTTVNIGALPSVPTLVP